MKKKYILFIIMVIILTGCTKEEKVKIVRKIDGCPNCVFSYSEKGIKYGSNGTKLKDYTTDYKELKDNNGEQRKYFLGHVLDNNGKVIRGFACGIENGTPFCIEGTTNRNKYENNIKKLKKIYGNKCEEFDNYIVCRGKLIAGTNKEGTADIGLEDISCIAINNNTQICE